MYFAPYIASKIARTNFVVIHRIKKGILAVLVNETKKPVCEAIAQFAGVLMKHNSDIEWENDVLEFVFDLCSASNPQKSEVRISHTAVGRMSFLTLTEEINFWVS